MLGAWLGLAWGLVDSISSTHDAQRDVFALRLENLDFGRSLELEGEGGGGGKKKCHNMYEDVDIHPFFFVPNIPLITIESNVEMLGWFDSIRFGFGLVWFGLEGEGEEEQGSPNSRK